MTKKDKYRELLWWLPLLLFIGCAVFFPVGIYNDTAQYIAMHIHRDPLYSFFLFLLRSLSKGADWYLTLAVWIQNILAGLSVIFLTLTVRRTFELKGIPTLIVCMTALAPHIVTPLASSSRLILSNSIMSEALTMPLFYFFAAKMIIALKKFCWKHMVAALILAVLLSLTRGQMTVMLIVWLISAIYMAVVTPAESGSDEKTSAANGSSPVESHDRKIRRGQLIKRIAVTVLAFILAIGAKNLLTKSYNLVFNNYFTGTGMSSVSMLTNVLYASDMDISMIDEDDVKAYYEAAAGKADELGYNYKYSEKGFMNRALDLENKHDRIKFECMDELWRTMHDSDPKYQFDYELEGMEQDRLAKVIISDILPECLGTWFYDYLALAAVGLIRTVAFVNPVMNIYAIMVYLIWIVGTVILIAGYLKKKYRSDGDILAIRFALFSMLAVCANVFGTASVIMCLSRYMVYTLPLVYISIFLILLRSYGNRRKAN